MPAHPVEPDGRPPRSAPLPVLCPYLATPDGTWRRANADREHHCMAVVPPVPLALEKQRRLCLVATHLDCATYGAAQAASAVTQERLAGHVRPIARMTPVILDQGRFDLRIPALRADRASGQALLVGLLGIAFVAILLARPAGDSGVASLPGATASPSALTASAGPTGTVEPAATLAPTEPAATPAESAEIPATPAASAAPSPAATAAPTTSGATYRVKSGDTLSAIAKRFGTTTRVLVQLNDLTDPSKLKVGQILKLP
jgi:LysM repeat protein